MSSETAEAKGVNATCWSLHAALGNHRPKYLTQYSIRSWNPRHPKLWLSHTGHFFFSYIMPFGKTSINKEVPKWDIRGQLGSKFHVEKVSSISITDTYLKLCLSFIRVTMLKQFRPLLEAATPISVIPGPIFFQSLLFRSHLFLSPRCFRASDIWQICSQLSVCDHFCLKLVSRPGHYYHFVGSLICLESWLFES